MRQRPTNDEFDDDGDADDPGDDDTSATIPCPHCGEEIHEDAQRCPYCEQYLSEEDRPTRPKPWLIAVGVLLCLVIVYCWIFGRV